MTFIDRPDYRFELSEDNDVVAIHVDSRRIANRMVEETMITANICAGRVLDASILVGDLPALWQESQPRIKVVSSEADVLELTPEDILGSARANSTENIDKEGS